MMSGMITTVETVHEPHRSHFGRSFAETRTGRMRDMAHCRQEESRAAAPKPTAAESEFAISWYQDSRIVSTVAPEIHGCCMAARVHAVGWREIVRFTGRKKNRVVGQCSHPPLLFWVVIGFRSEAPRFSLRWRGQGQQHYMDYFYPER